MMSSSMNSARISFIQKMWLYFKLPVNVGEEKWHGLNIDIHLQLKDDILPYNFIFLVIVHNM